MPTIQEHLERAERDISLANQLLQGTDEYLHWAATTIFYSALHHVNRLAVHLGESLEDHMATFQFLRTHFKELEKPYIKLSQASRIARYRSIKSFLALHPKKNIESTLRDLLWAKIKDYVDDYFAQLASP